MPLTYTRSFRIRHYECDAFGHLNNAHYLRFMQETASDASAAGGFGPQQYAEMKRMWYIRATEIEYLVPVTYGDTLLLTTWVADFRRVSSRRAYEFRKAGDNELVARANTDWVFLDSETEQPIAIAPELGPAFFPEGVPDSFPPRDPFPKLPPAPTGVFSTRQHVQWKDIDVMQHVNNAVYVDYANECGFQAVAHFGWPWQRMLAEGIAIFLRKTYIQYLQPALLGDELEISTWLSDVRRSSAMRHYTIHRTHDQANIAVLHTLGACVDLASGRPTRFPQNMLYDFAPGIVSSKNMEDAL